MTGCWVSICFLTGTCVLSEVTGVLGTSFTFYAALMNIRKLSLISLDVVFIDDTFYIDFCLIYEVANTHGMGTGYNGLFIKNWLQSERWFDLCLFS
ncbi:hypothetical protein AMTRI_Chr05g60330 [Amborella trichopoda]